MVKQEKNIIIKSGASRIADLKLSSSACRSSRRRKQLYFSHECDGLIV